VAITMFSPVGEIADSMDGDTPAGAGDVYLDRVEPTGAADGGGATGDAVSSLQVLTDAPPVESVASRGVVPVPPLTVLAIGLSVAFTVVFGIIPEPILDFAHQATLLFS
jgi:hypothetical protein